MTPVNATKVYNQFAKEYDQWFDKHANLYQSELLAMKQALPSKGTGIEMGAGSGRFSAPLQIKFGVEPSNSMSAIAKQRGVKIISGVAEKLPIENQSFDFATMVTAHIEQPQPGFGKGSFVVIRSEKTN